jgi:hypothetical protein
MPGKRTRYEFKFGPTRVNRYTENKDGSMSFGVTTPKQRLDIFIMSDGRVVEVENDKGAFYRVMEDL